MVVLTTWPFSKGREAGRMGGTEGRNRRIEVELGKVLKWEVKDGRELELRCDVNAVDML